MAFDPDKYLVEEDFKEQETAQKEFSPESYASESAEESGQLEALGRGIAEGGLLGFSEEAGAGIGTTLGKLASYIPGTEGYEDRKRIEEMAKKANVAMPEEDLIETYKELKASEEARRKELEEKWKKTSLAGEVLGGVLTGGVVGGAKSVGTTAAKTGLKELAKAGALAGGITGAGKAETLSDIPQDVVEGAFGGAVVGSGLGVLGKAAKGLYTGTKKAASMIPGAESAKRAFKYGAEEGKQLTSEQVRSDIKALSEDIYNTIKLKFKKYGMDKKEINKLADEMGVKVNNGQPLSSAIEDVVNTKALTSKSAQDKEKFVGFLRELQGDPKAIQDMEQTLAKKVAKGKAQGKNISSEMQLDEESGKLLGKTTEVTDPKLQLKESTKMFGGEKLPKTRPEQEDAYRALSEKVEKYKALKAQEGKVVESKIYIEPKTNRMMAKVTEKSTKQALPGEVRVNAQVKDVLPETVDVNNMSMAEAQSMLDEINRFTGMTGTPEIADPRIISQAKQLASQLNKKLSAGKDVVLEGAGLEAKKTSKLISALEKAGIDKMKKGPRDVAEDADIDKLRSLIGKTSEEGEVAKERFFQYLGEADKKLSVPAEIRTKQLSELRKLASGIEAKEEDITKYNLFKRFVAGTVPNAMGRGFNALQQQIAKDPMYIKSIAEGLSAAGGGAAKFAQPLMRAIEAPEVTRNALLFGLYQQPAFRKAIMDVGGIPLEALNDIIKDKKE